MFDRKEIIMPGGDRTGPAGMGPMTGRAAGFCAGYSVPGFANPIPGRGYGFGGRGMGMGRGGGGRGRRNMFYATGLPGWQRFGMGYPAYGNAAPYGMPYNPTVTPDQELNTLKGQAEYFSNALEEIKKRITELEIETKK
jgi:hypothetical protein